MVDLTLIPKNSVVAVALSGGKDSVCLLHYLSMRKEQLNITLKAINVEHGIRGEESKKDTEFCINLCKNLGVEIKTVSVDAIAFSKENKLSVENGARLLRYEFFNECLNSGFADYILTAHHKNDNFETVLLNLFRGTGIKGLTGISKTRDKFIRPMLSTEKSEIEEYISKNNLSFVEDKTNYENGYSRNYIRNVLTPLILDKFSGAIESVSRLTESVKEIDELLDKLANNSLINENGKIKISVSTEKAIFKRSVTLALINLGIKSDYEKVHIDDVYNLIFNENGTTVTLPKNVFAVREYDYVSFYKDIEKPTDNSILFNFESVVFNGKTITVSKTPLENSLKFDGDKIPKNTVIRFRKDGDVFTKFGGKTKKLKDYFIDKKINRFDRDFIPVLAVENQILIVFGVEISETVKIDDNSKNIFYTKVIN